MTGKEIGNAAHLPPGERNEVGLAVHKANPALIARDGGHVAAEERASAIVPQQRLEPGEVATHPQEAERRGWQRTDLLALPETQRRVGPAHVIAVPRVQPDRCVAERVAPVRRSGIEMRMGIAIA